MSKRKNPLQHLDDFLKKEASSLVTPKSLGDTDKEKTEAPRESVVEEQQPSSVKPVEVSKEHITELIRQLADKNNLSMRDQLLNLVQHIIENHTAGDAKDKMLINTVLIIKNPENWREKVEEYWEKAIV